MSQSANTNTATSSFEACDLFDIEERVEDFCSEHGGSTLWTWSWDDADDMSAMSQRLCDEGVDVDGEVGFIVEESVMGEKVGFRIVVGEVVVVVGGQSTPQ